jgi:Protein of unknown function (DUF2855)
VDFEVDRSNIRETRIVAAPPSDLEPGQARLRVDAFGLTANNVTYAAMGDALRYWDFFPAHDTGWGRVPVWGYATVVATAHDEVTDGARVYGYLPMSTQVVMTPQRVDERGFIDAAPHRAAMPSAYNGYLRTDTDPIHDPAREDHRMLLWPLFFTSFMIEDLLDDNGLFGATTAVVSSASSKTAIGTAFQLHRRGAAEVVGLTSPGNVRFVEGLGVYDRVVTYDDVARLPDAVAVFVDIAGDGAVRNAVHHAYGDRLAYSMMVGATHWDRPAPPPEALPGAPPTFFFAPDQIAKRAAEWGRADLDDRVASAWRAYVEFADGWLEVRRGAGPDAVGRAYAELVEGRADPTAGHILSM